MPENNYLIAMPNAIVPYGYEMIPILAYPNGFKFRFRFEEKYVDKDIQESVARLKGRNGYVVLRVRENGNLYPIRNFTVAQASKIGDIYHIEFSLGELIELDSTDDLRKKQLDEFNRDFQAMHSWLRNPDDKGNAAPLVFNSSYAPKMTNSSLKSSNELEIENEQWGNIIAGISEIDFFRDVQFLRIREVTSIDTKGFSYFKNGELHLEAGSDYEMDIVQRIIKPSGEDTSSDDVKLDSDTKVISMLRGSLRAVGRYDILKFRFHVNDQNSKKKSFLDILHVPKSGENRIEPRLGIQLQILANHQFPINKFAVSVALIFILLFPGLLSWIPLLSDEQTKSLSIASFAISTVFLISDLKNYWK